MPVIGRRPTLLLRETGEVVVITSEAARRSRGETRFLDATSGDPVFHLYETPVQTERLAWSCSIAEGEVPTEPTFTPILVRETDREKGTHPHVVRYLRHCIGPEAIYCTDTGEVQLFWWSNTFTPVEKVPGIVPCSTAEFKPTTTSSPTGVYCSYPEVTALGLDINLLARDPQTLTVSQAIPAFGDWRHAILGRNGVISLQLGARDDTPPTSQESWLGAALRITLSRVKVPFEAYPTFGLPPAPPAPPTPPTDQAALNGPFEEPNPGATAKVNVKLKADGQTYQFQWTDGNFELDLEAGEGGTNSFQMFTAQLRTDDPVSFASNLTLEVELAVNPVTAPTDGPFLGVAVAAVEVEMLCAAPEQPLILSFYNSHREFPAPYTLPLVPREPHFAPQITRDVEFNYDVGDPPSDPGSGWPGMYNRHTVHDILLTGGSADEKNWSPFPGSNAHLRIPVTPGLLRRSEVQQRGALVSLEAINDFMIEHTQNVYHVREMQDLRSSSRTLFHARGRFHQMEAVEEQPAQIDPLEEVAEQLVIGAANLIPAIEDEEYKGEAFIELFDTAIVFPFGASIVGSDGALVSIHPGEIGHQFTATGGQEPYRWTIRPTRSSNMPFVPTTVASPSPPGVPTLPPGPPAAGIPFDNVGTYIDPEADFPEAVMGGGLPPGMLLDKFGLLYGTPTESGSYFFRLHVRDKNDLHGEATVRIVVLPTEFDQPPCAKPEGSIAFTTTIAQTQVPPIFTGDDAENWKGKVEVIGGNKPYQYLFPDPFDFPNQAIPLTSAGAPAVNIDNKGRLTAPGIDETNYTAFTGLWIWEVEVSDTAAPGGTSSCDRRALTLVVNVEPVAGEGIPDQFSGSRVLPEGDYRRRHPSRSYLVLDPPIAVKSFAQGKSMFMRGTRGHTVRFDIGGPYIGPGPIIAVSPGVMTPTSVVGAFELPQQAPAHIQLDWAVTNPISLYRDMVDRFDDFLTPDPPPGPPLPPGTEPEEDEVIKGASIDHQIGIGKRIRPLWPV